MKRFKRIVSWVALICLVCILTGTVYANTNIQDQIGVKWWTMNQAHDGAEICRRLGGDNSAALAYFGERWTTANNERKELEAQAKESLGTWTITAYCNDGQSASGRPNIAGQTCACNCLPFGTVIEVEGMGRFTVTDRGASSGKWAWHNSNWADIYLSSESECNAWGVQHRRVWRVK